MTTQPQRICDICGIPIHAQPTAFHPDGPSEGKQRWAHLACASKHKAAQAEAAERLSRAAPAMLAALEAFVSMDIGHEMWPEFKAAMVAIKLARGEGT